MRQPTQCPAGTFNGKLSATTPASCAKCPVSTFADAAGASACRKCDAGRWTGRLTGQRQCWPTSAALPTAAAAAGRRKR